MLGLLFTVVIGFGVSFSMLQVTDNAWVTWGSHDDCTKEVERKFTSLLLKHTKEMELKYNSLFDEFNAFKQKFKMLENENEALKRKVDVIRQKSDLVEKQLFKLNETVNVSKCDYVKCSGNIKQNMTNRTYAQNPNSKQERGSELLFRKSRDASISQENMDERTGYLPDTIRGIAFYARLSKPMMDPHYNQHIEFDEVLLNLGDAYMDQVATFICPTPGTYAFFVTILTFQNKTFTAEIVVNGRELAHISCSDTNNQNSASNMAIVELNKTDAVWVRVNADLHGNGYVLKQTWSTFSGYILWQNS